MPRRPRIKIAGMPQHIVQRGINREACFFADEDYHCEINGNQQINGVSLQKAERTTTWVTNES